MSFFEVLGYCGAALAIIGSSMRTMIPLRIIGIVTNVVFLTYGIALGLYPTMIVNGVLLPLNGWRLFQMIQLVRQVRKAACGDLSMDWLKPFMSRQRVAAAAKLFEKGDIADRMFFTLSGRYRLTESGHQLGPGVIVGELGLLSPDQRRTQSVECIEAGEVLTITYDELRQLQFQNPAFGFYFLRLTSRRLFENLAAREAEIEDLRRRSTVSEAA
jgi:CRP/FNR family transcriptional regulator, cyclic AMP receptor protein